MDDKSQMKAIQNSIRKLIKPLRQVADKKLTKMPTADEIEKLAAAIPSGATLAEAVETQKRQLMQVVADVRKTRAETFRRVVSEFIRELKASGEATTETADGWQIGPVELQLKVERGEARATYNKAPISPASRWAVVTTKQDLADLRADAMKMLKSAEERFSDDLIKQLMMDAYRTAVAGRREAKTPRAELVPIVDLHRAFRIALVAHELEGQKPDKTLGSASMPRWCFLHILDRYQQLSGRLNAKERLVYQTGAQAEQAKGIGYMLGGLDPQHRYRVYCHVLLHA